MVDRKAALGGIGGLRPLGQGLDEVFVVELDLEGRAGEVFRRKLKRGRGEVDALIVVAPGPRQDFAHLTRVAAGDINKGEGPRDSVERIVQKLASRSMRDRVGVHKLLIGRPLLLKLLQGVPVGHRLFKRKLADEDVDHSMPVIRSNRRKICNGRLWPYPQLITSPGASLFLSWASR